MMGIDSRQSATGTSLEKANVKSTLQFVGFVLAGQEYAFRIDHIREIVIPERVTRIPQVAEYVEGCCNLRGTIIPVINLRILLGLEAKTGDAQTRTIVAQVGSRTVGCTVDEVTQVLRIATDQIQSASTVLSSGQTTYISGIAKIDTRLMILLDIEQLLDITKLDEIHQLARSNGLSSMTSDATSTSQ